MSKRTHRPYHPGWQRTLATCLAVSFGLVSAIEPAIRSAAAQTATPAPVPVRSDEGKLDQPKLEQLLAPVALYPDTLLAMMFMASTYPLEVVQAERWLGRDGNAKLKGDGLAKALEQQPWDDSVKSLAPIPDVLKMMAEQLEWTQQVGDAVLAQQQDVLNAVQVLRGRAQRAGKLESGPQQTVNVTQNTVVTAPQAGSSGGGVQYAVPPPQEIIVIAPTQPEQIYVPVYNPSVVYGGWPYPASPPYYYPPPAGYAVGSALLTGMAFIGAAALVGSAWGWANPSWGGGNINVNRNINNNVNINRNQVAVAGNTWQHNSAHRQGVAYNNQGVRNQYQPNRGAQNASREEFRGRAQQAQGGGARQGVGTPGAAAGARPGAGSPGAAAGARPGAGGQGAAGQRPNVQRPSQGAAGAAGAAGNRAAAGGGAGFGGGQAASGRPSVGGPAGGRQPGGGGPQGFQGIGQGGDARAAGQRGQASRQSRPSPSMGQANRGGGGAQARGGGGGGGGGGRGDGGGGRGGGRGGR
jgi:hypothetical protein